MPPPTTGDAGATVPAGGGPVRLTRKPPKGTTTPEFRAILSAAEKRNPDAADLILFMGETGWRFSEATALDVGDVDDDGTGVWVKRGDGQGFVRSGRRGPKGHVHIHPWHSPGMLSEAGSRRR